MRCSVIAGPVLRARVSPGRYPGLYGRGLPVAAGQSLTEAHSGSDSKLGEHLAQVPFDGARTDEQPRADLRVGEPVAGEPGDLLLLSGEVIAHLDGALAHL